MRRGPALCLLLMLAACSDSDPEPFPGTFVTDPEPTAEAIVFDVDVKTKALNYGEKQRNRFVEAAKKDAEHVRKGKTRLEVTFEPDGTLTSVRYHNEKRQPASGSWLRNGEELDIRLQPQNGASEQVKARIVDDRVVFLAPSGGHVIHVLKKKP